MDHSSRNRKLIFELMFAMIGMRLLIFALDVSGIIAWGPSLGVSVLSWILPVGMPVAMISITLLFGRKKMAANSQTPQASDSVPLSQVLQERLARGEISEGQYEEMKRILRDKEHVES